MYVHNHSPWLRQLRRQKALAPLQHDVTVDVVIIGAGISGISTAYQILKETPKSVLLIEADKVAHGATGHNAGQIASYFERSLWSMAEEYGVEQTCAAQRDVESAWDILQEMARAVGMADQYWSFTGYAGCTTLAQVVHYLQSNKVRRDGGLSLQTLFVAEDAPWIQQIPQGYTGLYELCPRAQIHEALGTDNQDFAAMLASKKGCTNSALFCENVLTYLQKVYWDRFQCVEQSPIDLVELYDSMAECHTTSGVVATGTQVVLCTNGFEHFRIENRSGVAIDGRFHMEVEGKVGLMAGYIEEETRPPMAVSYFPTEVQDPSEDAYFYVTRRPFAAGEETKTLLCIGGPDHPLEHHTYSRSEAYVNDFQHQIDDFVQKTYRHHPSIPISYAFLWHGLMGYTKNRLRLIGQDPTNPVLLYNLGCNGVGILPSLFGAKKIAGLLAGKTYPPSLFDPFSAC